MLILKIHLILMNLIAIMGAISLLIYDDDIENRKITIILMFFLFIPMIIYLILN